MHHSYARYALCWSLVQNQNKKNIICDTKICKLLNGMNTFHGALSKPLTMLIYDANTKKRNPAGVMDEYYSCLSHSP